MSLNPPHDTRDLEGEDSPLSGTSSELPPDSFEGVGDDSFPVTDPGKGSNTLTSN